MELPWRSPRLSLVAGPIIEIAPPATLGFHGDDLAALRPDLSVAEGQRVAAGAPLFRDRKRPWLVAVAPVPGVIARLERGPRRGLSALEIRPEGEDAQTFDTTRADTREGLAALMVEAGLWPMLRARPFGHAPDPATVPEALFVTAIETAPGAPDATEVIGAFAAWFQRGLAALPLLTPGRVWLCHAPTLTPPATPGVTARAFQGGHPAGLPGVHIHALHPVAHGGTVWQIGWQEVIALGCLLETARIWQRRIVALSGDGAARPGLLAAAPGTRLHDIAAGRLAEGPLRLLAGSALDGVAHPVLRPGIRQMTALRHDGRAPRAVPSPALIPNAWAERLVPTGILAVPFLRALVSGDAETARRLGALGLLEEDLAPLNAILARPGLDYTALLRQTLNELEDMA